MPYNAILAQTCSQAKMLELNSLLLVRKPTLGRTKMSRYARFIKTQIMPSELMYYVLVQHFITILTKNPTKLKRFQRKCSKF